MLIFTLAILASGFYDLSMRKRQINFRIVALLATLSTTTYAVPPKGWLDHASQNFAVGWSCDSDEYTAPVWVELYATGTPGDGTCQTIDGKTACRTKSAWADKWRPGDVATLCGNIDSRGFRIPMTANPDNPYDPLNLNDRLTHDLFAVATDAGNGSRTVLGGRVSYNSDTLYRQEMIDNIDDQIVVNHGFAQNGRSATDVDFFSADHMLLVTYTPAQWREIRERYPFESSLNSDVSAATGFRPPSPLDRWQRGIKSASGTGFVAFQAYHYSVGLFLSMDTWPIYSGGMFFQTGWKTPQQLFRGVDEDYLRVSGHFRQPTEFEDAPMTSLDAMSYWYWVVYMENGLLLKPNGLPTGLWFTVPVYASRTAGNPHWREISDGVSDYFFVDAGRDLYTSVPLADRTSYIRPCTNSNFFSQDPYDGEHYVCFELTAAMLRNALRALIPKYGLPSLAARTEPSDWKAKFALVNAEAQRFGNANGIALSMRDMRIERIWVNHGTYGYGGISGGTINGWACDPDDPARALEVHIYATNVKGCEGSADPPCFLTGVAADRARESAVEVACWGYSHHGFELPIPNELRDGEVHDVSIFPINYPNGSNSQVIGSPVRYP